MTTKTRFPVGTKFITRGKHPKECEVVDIHVTRNLQNEVVKVRYVAVHKLLNQNVFDYDVVSATIARGIIEE